MLLGFFFCHNKSKGKVNTVHAFMMGVWVGLGWGRALSIIYLHAFQYSSEFFKKRKKKKKKNQQPRSLEGYMAAACADEYGSIPVLVIPGKSM